MKKFHKENFASGVDRSEVQKGLKILGVEIEKMIYFIIGVLQPHSSDIDLPSIDDLINLNSLNLEVKIDQ